MSKKKKVPKFRSEDEEREFWAKSDSTGYVDWEKAKRVVRLDEELRTSKSKGTET